MRHFKNRALIIQRKHIQHRALRGINSIMVKDTKSNKLSNKTGRPSKIYQEKPERWHGQFTVTKTSSKVISVTDGNNVKEFNITSILPTISQTNERGLNHNMETITTSVDNIHYSYETYVTKIVIKYDPRLYHNQQRKVSLSLEISGLRDRKAFAFISIWSTSRYNGNVLGSSTIMEIENPGTDHQRYEANFCCTGTQR